MSGARAMARRLPPLGLSLTGVAVFALMVLGAAGAYGLTPRVNVAARQAVDLESLIPASFGPWHAAPTGPLVMPDPETDELTRRLYSGLLARAYENASGQRVLLVVAYGGDQSDDLQLHRPEVCYAASGYRVTGTQKDTLALTDATLRLTRVATRDSYADEMVSYWMRVGPRQVVSTLDRQWVKLKSGLAGRVPDGVLVRVSTRQAGADPDIAIALQNAFLTDFVAALTPPARDLLLGEATGQGGAA